MFVPARRDQAAEEPISQSFLKLAGSGLIVAASGIGSGDVVPAKGK